MVIIDVVVFELLIYFKGFNDVELGMLTALKHIYRHRGDTQVQQNAPDPITFTDQIKRKKT